jgi:hypothetical protein
MAANWIECEGGLWVNADLMPVAQVSQEMHPLLKGAQFVVTFKDLQGQVIGDTAMHGYELAHVVPATAGQFVVVLKNIQSESGEDGFLVWPETYPVLAWRLHRSFPRQPHAILPLEVNEDEDQFLKLPEGRLLELNRKDAGLERHFDNLSQAIKAVRARLKKERDASAAGSNSKEAVA